MSIWYINPWDILTLAALSFAIALLWYGPLFGKTWMKLAKMKPSDMKMRVGTMALGFINTLITTFFVVYVVLALQASTWEGGMIFGFLLAIGFAGTTLLSDVLWEKKPFDLYLIHFGFRLVSFSLTGALAVWWPW